jgi:uncharacterized protein (TIGR02147 family)
MRTPRKPNVFKYSNYRTFLADSFTFRKKNDRSFTTRVYAQLAGLKSHVFLHEVIAGKRNLSENSMRKVIAPFDPTPAQAEYFYHLVGFNQAPEEYEKNIHYAAMIQQQKKAQSKTLTASQYIYYSHWYNSVVRAMVTLANYRNDPEWIGKQITPNLTAGQVNKAIRLLLKLGLLHREADGRLVQDTSRLEIDPDVSTLSIRNFNRNMIELGKEAIERFSPEEREVSGITIGVSHEGYARIKEMVRRFQDEVIEFVNGEEKKVERICQLNFQLFPFTPRQEAGAETPPAATAPAGETKIEETHENKPETGSDPAR